MGPPASGHRPTFWPDDAQPHRNARKNVLGSDTVARHADVTEAFELSGESATAEPSSWRRLERAARRATSP
jgi:hypothetical protein